MRVRDPPFEARSCTRRYDLIIKRLAREVHLTDKTDEILLLHLGQQAVGHLQRRTRILRCKERNERASAGSRMVSSKEAGTDVASGMEVGASRCLPNAICTY